jgi:hypothetical protein
MHAQSCASRASVFGGKNSNESAGTSWAASRTGIPVKRGPVSHRWSGGKPEWRAETGSVSPFRDVGVIVCPSG